jgi:hypothetical protein
MSLSAKSNTIAGGIDVSSDTVVCGGQERVVGENTKWHMRNKYLQLKHLSKSSTVNEKGLLKIVNLKLPLTFGKKLKFYDDDKKDMPVKSEKKSSYEKHAKAMEVLKNRLDESIDVIVNRLVTEYNLRAPLFWVLGDIVRFLAVVNKRKKPNARKIKISPEMAVLMEKIWKNKSFFKYVVNSDEVPNNMMELMVYMLETIEKNKPPKGKWVEPRLEMIKHPCWCSISKNKLAEKIAGEKKKLKQKIKEDGDIKDIDVLKEYVFTILNIENMLINYVDDTEKYFVHLAKNMSKIFSSLKKFFKV